MRSWVFMSAWERLRVLWALSVFLLFAFGFVHLSVWGAYVSGVGVGVLLGELLSMTALMKKIGARKDV